MQSLDKIKEKISLGRQQKLAFAKKSLLYYLQSVIINSAPNPRPFGEVAEPWQRQLIASKVPAFEYLAGLNPDYYIQGRVTNRPLSFMDVLPRGHDKSSLEGRLLSWLLIASKKPINAYILAADADQGTLILEAMETEARLNPWLHQHLKFAMSKRIVTGPAGTVKVIPADAKSAWGLRGNLYICDEITNWPERGIKMWEAVISGREKIPGSLLLLLTNAGLLGSWQHDVRMRIAEDPDWLLFEKEGQLASWMSKERVDKLRLILPPSEAERVYDNRWIDPATEFDYLRRTEIERCVQRAKEYGLVIQFRREPTRNNYVAAIDYGAKRDRTALCILHVNEKRECVVDRLDVWQGSPENPVSIPQVEEWIKEARRNFNPVLFVLDPSNLEGTCQWMEKNHYPLERFNPRGGAGNFELAMHLRSIIVNQQLLWYPTAGDLLVEKYGRTGTETLVDELAGLRVKRMPYGYRFDHEAQKHDDRAVAIGMGALRAFQFTNSDAVRFSKPVLMTESKIPGYSEPPSRLSYH